GERPPAKEEGAREAPGRRARGCPQGRQEEVGAGRWRLALVSDAGAKDADTRCVELDDRPGTKALAEVVRERDAERLDGERVARVELLLARGSRDDVREDTACGRERPPRPELTVDPRAHRHARRVDLV